MQNGSRKEKKIQPVAIEKNCTQKIWSNRAIIRSNNECEFVIEISNEKERKILPTITSLSSSQIQERVEVEIFPCDKVNQSQGMIYIYDYNIPDIKDYGSELKKEYNLFFSIPTDFQRKKTTEIIRNPEKTSKN